jgi:AcrR family transcriptional regulator
MGRPEAMGVVEPRGRVRAKAIEKRQRILDATAKVIAERRSADIPLQDVANEVGIYAASIYYYFPSREELIKEVVIASLARFRAKILDEINALPPGAAPVDRVRQAILAMVKMGASADDYALAYNQVFEPAGRPMDEDIRRGRQAVRDLWAGLLKDVQAAGQLSAEVDLNLLRYFLVGASHWVSRRYKPSGPRTPEEIADAFVDLLLNGAGRK